MVRSHGKILTLNFSDLCRLFNLTANGAWEILRGSDWRPEYDMNAERERRLTLIRAAAQKFAHGQAAKERSWKR